MPQIPCIPYIPYITYSIVYIKSHIRRLISYIISTYHNHIPNTSYWSAWLVESDSQRIRRLLNLQPSKSKSKSKIQIRIRIRIANRKIPKKQKKKLLPVKGVDTIPFWKGRRLPLAFPPRENQTPVQRSFFALCSSALCALLSAFCCCLLTPSQRISQQKLASGYP